MNNKFGKLNKIMNLIVADMYIYWSLRDRWSSNQNVWPVVVQFNLIQYDLSPNMVASEAIGKW